MRKRPGILLPLVVGIVALLGFGGLWAVLDPGVASPTSTIIWMVSEVVLALALAVPAVSLFFVIRALHIRRVQAREAVGPDAIGLAKGRDLLWSLSHGLLPQTAPPGNAPTDATELVFISEPMTVSLHSIPAPGMWRLARAAREHGDTGTARRTGWGQAALADVTATDRRILIGLSGGLVDLSYSEITEVHFGRGQLVLRIRDRAPVLLTGDAAESLAVLAVWGSVGESALRRHPALAELRT